MLRRVGRQGGLYIPIGSAASPLLHFPVTQLAKLLAVVVHGGAIMSGCCLESSDSNVDPVKDRIRKLSTR